MALYLRTGDYCDLHESEMNGKTSKYKPKNSPGTRITYAGMPTPESFSLIYTKTTDNGTTNGNLFFHLKPGQDTLEVIISGIKFSFSEISPERVLVVEMRHEQL